MAVLVRAGIWSINLESLALVVARFQMKKNAAPLSLWLLILLGVSRKIKCFLGFCLPVMVMCTCPVTSTCVPRVALMLLLVTEPFTARLLGLHSHLNGSQGYFRSLFKCSLSIRCSTISCLAIRCWVSYSVNSQFLSPLRLFSVLPPQSLLLCLFQFKWC